MQQGVVPVLADENDDEFGSTWIPTGPCLLIDDHFFLFFEAAAAAASATAFSSFSFLAR